MILDRLDNADTYAAIDGLADAFAFLRRGGFEELATGRHEAGGERTGPAASPARPCRPSRWS